MEQTVSTETSDNFTRLHVLKIQKLVELFFVITVRRSSEITGPRKFLAMKLNQ
jgi:hypothetical protein